MILRKFNYIVFLIVLISFSAQGYQTDTISEQNINFILKEKDLTKVKSFLQQQYSHNTLASSKYYKLFLERGIQDKDDHIQLWSHYYLADIAYENGDYATALQHGERMLTIAEQNQNSDQQISALNQLGITFYKIRKYEQALTYFLKAKTLQKELDPDHLQLGVLANINMIRTRIHRYDDALQSYEEIIDILSHKKPESVSNYWNNYLSSMLGAGVCNFHLKKYEEALSWYQKGQKIAIEQGLKQKEVIFDMTIGETYTAQQDFKQAIPYLDRANEYYKTSSTNFDPKLHTSYFHLGTVFYHLEEYQKTLDYLAESFQTIEKQEKQNEVEKIGEMYDLAYRAAKKTNNTALIIKYSDAYKGVINSFYKDDHKAKDLLYDQDINDLEEQNQDLSSQKFIYIILSIVFICLITLLSIYHLRKQRKNKQLFHQLQQKYLIETEKNKDIVKPITEAVETSKKEFVTDEKADTLLQKLKELEKTKFYLDIECNLYNTAKLIDTNTTYLSKIINEHKQHSFNEYINSLRIKYCIEQLESNRKFSSFTIKAISAELGYKSVNTFTAAFKRQTGITHSYYIKQILKKREATEVEELV